MVFTFSESLLETLNQYTADGLFGFGIDPDCHYLFDNGGIEFEITTTVGDKALSEPAHTPAPGGNYARKRRYRLGWLAQKTKNPVAKIKTVNKKITALSPAKKCGAERRLRFGNRSIRECAQ